MQISGQTLGCREIRWRLLLTAGLCRHCWLSVQEEEKERVRHFWELQSCCLFDGLVVGLNIHRLDLNWFARLSIMQPWLWNCLLPLHALSKGIKRIKLFRQYLWKHIKDLSKPRRFDCRSSFEDDTHAQGLRRQTFRRNLYEPFYWEKGWRLYRNTSIIQSQVCHIRPHAKIHPRVLNQVGGEMRPDTWEMVDRLNNREEWGEKESRSAWGPRGLALRCRILTPHADWCDRRIPSISKENLPIHSSHVFNMLWRRMQLGYYGVGELFLGFLVNSQLTLTLLKWL